MCIICLLKGLFEAMGMNVEIFELPSIEDFEPPADYNPFQAIIDAEKAKRTPGEQFIEIVNEKGQKEKIYYAD